MDTDNSKRGQAILKRRYVRWLIFLAFLGVLIIILTAILDRTGSMIMLFESVSLTSVLYTTGIGVILCAVILYWICPLKNKTPDQEKLQESREQKLKDRTKKWVQAKKNHR